MRASALSDPQVINIVNEFCIALPLNVTKQGFPVSQIPALIPVQIVYQTNWRHEFGFASCYIIDPQGTIILGTSVTQVIQEPLTPEILFSSKIFINFLVSSLERHEKLKKIRQMPPWQSLKAFGEFAVDIKAEIQKSVIGMRSFLQSFQ